MTYIPKGTKRHWTAEEESLLAEGWGVCGVPALAKKLNRSQQAIKIRASRLHLGPLLMGGDYVTLNQLVTAFNRTGSYAYASPSNQGVRCRLVNFTILDGKEEKNLPRIGSWRSDDIWTRIKALKFVRC